MEKEFWGSGNQMDPRKLSVKAIAVPQNGSELGPGPSKCGGECGAANRRVNGSLWMTELTFPCPPILAEVWCFYSGDNEREGGGALLAHRPRDSVEGGRH